MQQQHQKTLNPQTRVNNMAGTGASAESAASSRQQGEPQFRHYYADFDQNLAQADIFAE